MDSNKVPEFTKGFIIFAIIVMMAMSVVLALLNLPTGMGLVIAILIGWNVRKFYFGPWQVFQTACLISLNNWLTKDKDNGEG